MTHHPRPDSPEPPPLIGAGYAVGQLAQALTTAAEHADPATRARAQQRVAKWEAVLRGLLDGTLAVGSRTPLAGVPNWVTLQVVTGGFATGALLAAGPLQPHEQAALAQHFPNADPADARRVLNGFYLTEAGLAELHAQLQSGHYDVALPEEGALLTVAWLAHNHYPEEARALLETLGPWLGQLRFYPIPTDRARPSGPRIQLQTVATTVERLAQVKPNPQILAQKEAVSVWTPLYDRLLALFCETVTGELPSLMCDAEGQWTRDANGRFPVQGGWPCQHYPADWAARATAWLAEYDAQCAAPKLCKRPTDAKTPLAQVSALLRRCVQAPHTLTGREVGRLRQILATYITKHGVPLTPAQQAQRDRELAHATAPTFHAIAQALCPRLQTYPGDEGLEEVAPVLEPLSAAEAAQWQLPDGTRIPATLQNKVLRCLKDTVEALVERGWITSGEVLAQVLPQLTAGVRASGFTDPALRRLVAALYAAFRRRRSLLLLNLEKQVQFEELPWVAALENFRRTDLSAQELAQQTLQEVTRLALSAFPHAILPNKLLQELTALARTAALDWPLVEEVAADIFMGEFSAKYLAAAHRAAHLLENTLYATYYGIDAQQILALPAPAKQWRYGAPPSALATLCAARAGAKLGVWDPANNGMIIEQQQILTTQNLAVLWAGLPTLAAALRPQLPDLAQQCFIWVCARQQIKTDRWHARLIQLKNTAYAWRQMIFFLAQLSPAEVTAFLQWATAHLAAQPEPFHQRFQPALTGLTLAAAGHAPASVAWQQAGARQFLGWSKARHWLLPEAAR